MLLFKLTLTLIRPLVVMVLKIFPTPVNFAISAGSPSSCAILKLQNAFTALMIFKMNTTTRWKVREKFKTIVGSINNITNCFRTKSTYLVLDAGERYKIKGK